jgi:diguanylate cyclase (GGDEF)-like protein/PAS domain S-box-containing protein
MTSAPHLLIVDDDLTTLKMLHKALEGMGEVHTASSGAQALQIVAEHPIDLVLLDIIMPEMDGFATCRALLQTQPDMTVLFVTVVSDTGSEVAALEVGGRDFISKPINPPVVRARVALHLKLKAQHRERRAMEEAIRALNANLEQQVERRTADLCATNAALRESEERYRLLFDNIADPVIILDLPGQVLAVNDQACRSYGYAREAFMTLHITDIDRSEDAIRVPGRFALLNQQGEATFEAVHRDADGRLIPVEVRATRIMLDGQAAILGLCHDITARKEAELAIKRSRADLERAQAIAHLGSWSMDLATHTLQWSKETYRLFGIEIGAAISYESFLGCIHPEDRARIKANWQRVAVGERSFEDTFRIIVNDEVKWLRTIYEYECDENGTLRSLFGTTQDITEQVKARQQIEYLAFHDDLTGLSNRVLGQSRLQQAIASASRQGRGLAVLHLDLNQFKYVNDTHGHRLGDRLLQAVAGRLSQTLWADDTLCRLSGDEFMLVLPQVPSPQVVAPIANDCDRVLSAFASPFDLDGLKLFVTLSIGVAIYPQDGGDGETLMCHANTALFEAKKAEQHSYRFFAPQMNADLMRFVQTRDHLRAALEHEEFELYYQPQIDLHSRRVVGVEALIRWQRPVEGLTLPAHFIAVAEESGLIVPIGQWVLQEACRQAAAWCDLGWRDCVVAVNLSAVHFRHGQVEQDVMVALEASGLDPAKLELELTESILLDNSEAVIATVSRWKARGIRLSIDDFGTGYSSLAYLKRFKVDKLKIDRSFITHLQTDADDLAIVQAIIQIARSLNLKTIAEGVDHAALADQLKCIGCDEVQGYLYSEPLPAAELEQWLNENGCFRRLA